MTDWAKAINPTAALATEDDAISAARGSAIAIFLGVVWGVVGIIYLMTAGQAAMQAAVTQASAESPGMVGAVGQIALWTAIFFVVAQAVIGFIQWSKPNIVIPIIFLILVVFGLIMGVFGLMMANSMPEVAEAQAQTPAWQTWIGMLLMIVQAVMHIAGIRGASALDKIRTRAAQEY